MLERGSEGPRAFYGPTAVIATTMLLGSLSACDQAAELPTATAPPRYPTRVQLVVVQGSAQCAEPSSPLGEALSVRLIDDEDRPLSEVKVNWRVIRGGGDLSAAWSVTDSLGRAAVQYALGTNVVRASIESPRLEATPIAFFSHAVEDDGSDRSIFEQSVPDGRPDTRGLFRHSRYILYSDDTFEFMNETEVGEVTDWGGTYSRSDTLIAFSYPWGRVHGVIDAAELTVELDPFALLSDYSGSGVFTLCSTG